MLKHPALRTGLLLAVGILAVGILAGQAGPAQAISDRRDQPTPADLPQESKSGDGAASRPVGDVKPPSAIAPSTAVTVGDGKSKNSRTNPLDHLPERDRAGTGGRKE